MKDTARSASNAANLRRALGFLRALIDARVRDWQGQEAGSLPEPGYFDDGSQFGTFVRDRQPSFSDWVVILLALAPHLDPQLLDTALQSSLKKSGDLPLVGTRREPHSRALIATGETASFLLAGDDLEARFDVHALFAPDHWLVAEGIVTLEPPEPAVDRL